MKGLFWAIVFIIFGCWIWNKYSSGIESIYKTSEDVLVTSASTIDSAKTKVNELKGLWKDGTKEFENKK